MRTSHRIARFEARAFLSNATRTVILGIDALLDVVERGNNGPLEELLEPLFHERPVLVTGREKCAPVRPERVGNDALILLAR